MITTPPLSLVQTLFCQRAGPVKSYGYTKPLTLDSKRNNHKITGDDFRLNLGGKNSIEVTHPLTRLTSSRNI